MERLLHYKVLYVLLEGHIAKSETMYADDWKKHSHKTIGTIWQSVDYVVFHHVSNETSPARRSLLEEDSQQQNFLN